MGTRLLTTKLYIPPPRPNLVPRPRLIERLNAGLHRKLTLVSGPAGFGKTTLLSEWVHQIESRNRKLDNGPASLSPIPNIQYPQIAWLSLDEEDNDPARFWAYAIAALQTIHAYKDVGNMVLAALDSPQPLLTEALLTGLINEIAAIPQCDHKDHRILVLDDFHIITSPQINDAVAFLLNNLPPPMHLVISTRADPPWPLARLRARRQINELRIDDLRFTATEAAAFLNDVMGLGLSPEDIATLDGRTEGWIVGLQLAALSMKGREDTSAFIQTFSGSHRFILDYLVEEVLNRQPPDIQEFLLETCILERMTAPLCDVVAKRIDSRDILNQLGRANLFLIPLDDERRWYRYHHLFGDLLRSRLEEVQPGQSSALHRRASEWYAGAELVEEAIAHALAGQDMERAASLVEQHAMQMIVHSKVVTLSRWLDALPDHLIQVRPWLCVYRAWTQYWTGRREQAEKCLQNAEQALQNITLPSPAKGPVLSEIEGERIAGHIAVIRAYSALVNEEVSRVVEMAQTALELLPEGEHMRCMASLILGGAHWGRGDVEASQQSFARASADARKSGYRFLAVSATCYAGMQQAKQARLYEALETYREALELAAGPGGRELPVSGFPLVRLGNLAREWNDLETASRELSRGVELCAQWGQTDILADGYIALARLQLAQRDWEQAANTLQKAEQLVRKTKPDPWITCWLDDCRLRLWLSVGNLAAAIRWARGSGLRADGELSYQHDLHHVNLARVLAAQGAQRPSGPYLDQALGLLARLLEAAGTAKWTSEAIRILILQALAFQARGEGEKASAALDSALALAEPGGYVRVFIDEGAPMRLLISDLRSRIGERARSESEPSSYLLLAYIDKLLATFPSLGLAEKDEPAIIEPLSERELEVLRLLASHLSRTEIAQELFISVNTARSHIKNIYAKLMVHRRKEAIQRAKDWGLL